MTEIEIAMQIITRAQQGTAPVDHQTAEDAVETIVGGTTDTYTREATSYMDLRDVVPCAWDAPMNDLLLDTVRARIGSGRLAVEPDGKWKLLDIGAGYGRDVMFFGREPDIKPYAVEKAEGFVRALESLQKKGDIASDAVYAADMRDLSIIGDGTFECVRNHAALLHLPLVGDGLGADAAVAETWRILKPGGVFYVFVKAGDGIQMINTGEGLSGRFYQLYTADLLTGLLKRHDFTIIHHEERVEPRPSVDVDWLFYLATKA